jgi:hypothetical protein
LNLKDFQLSSYSFSVIFIGKNGNGVYNMYVLLVDLQVVPEFAMTEEDDCMPVRSYKNKGQRIYPSSYDSFEALLKGSDNQMEISLNVWHHQRYFPTLCLKLSLGFCPRAL